MSAILIIWSEMSVVAPKWRIQMPSEFGIIHVH